MPQTFTRRRVGEKDLVWADVVFAMEQEHKPWIATRFEGRDLPRIDVLDIPDEFELMEPRIQEIVKPLLDAELEHLLAEKR